MQKTFNHTLNIGALVHAIVYFLIIIKNLTILNGRVLVICECELQSGL